MSRANEKHRERRAFEKEAAQYILGETRSIDLSGTKPQVDVVSSVLTASRSLYRVLSRDSSLDECHQALIIKRQAAVTFQHSFGYIWPF